ncbi:MAG: deoxyribodipyrimidine photolyase [archaeon]|nr:deoxyribodipyrimidine photolyase [archaeon]
MISEHRIRRFGVSKDVTSCVVYWMISARRTTFNHGLEHAIDCAKKENLPLVVVEPLALKHKWTNDRFHTFVIQGMLENKSAFENSGVAYIPYVETKPKEASGLLKAWMEFAKILVIDDYPTYHPKKVIEHAISYNSCEIHCVDSNGFIGMHSADRDFTTAYSLRRHLHNTILQHMQDFPFRAPLKQAQGLPEIEQSKIEEVFLKSATPMTPYEFLWRASQGDEIGKEALSVLSIDHNVTPVHHLKGGQKQAHELWMDFFEHKLLKYHEDRNHPELNGASGLSPYLHFGHISVHKILSDLFRKYHWDISKIQPPNDGRRSGWWNLPHPIESFLDQIITWRDLGFIHCARDPLHASYSSLPDWAKTTLSEHMTDKREYVYSFEQFENAETHDDLWNAAQNQLKSDGVIQNYLRMLWGKKILEWTPDPQTAMEIMIALNDKWALDGRDPNSYTGIGWVLGKFDRAWNERQVFGKIRCMTTPSTKRKYSTKQYIETYSGELAQ